MLVGTMAAVVLASPAVATLTFQRTDYPLPAAPPSRIGTGYEDQPVALADLNMDGKPDIVVADSLLGVIYVFLNQGDGTFAAASSSPFTACYHADNVVTGQFNPVADQLPDVIVACANGIVRLLGDGHGALGAPEPFLSGAIDRIHVSRMSGAPQGDLLYGKGGGACFFPITALGDGTTVETCGGGGGPLNTVTPVHFYDGPCGSDEILGFAVPNPPAYALEILSIGNACSTPFASVDRQSGVVGPTIAPLSIAAADLDHDLDPDVVIGDSSGTFYVQAWTANGIPASQAPASFASVDRITSIAIADFDGDGNVDIAATEDRPSGGSNLVAVHLGHGSSSQFDGPLTFPVTGDLETYTDTPQMAVGDLNGDDKPDIVVVATYAGAMTVLLNGGGGAGTTTTTTTTLPAAPCSSIPSCLAALAAELPTPAGAANKKLKRTASKLQGRYRAVGKTLTRAGSKVGKKQAALYAKSRAQLQALSAAAAKAATKGTLGVPLPPLQAAVAALLGEIP